MNHAFDNPEVKEEAERRANICALCLHNKNNVCSGKVESEVQADFTYGDEARVKGQLVRGCSCPIPQKTKSPNTQCPTNRW